MFRELRLWQVRSDEQRGLGHRHQDIQALSLQPLPEQGRDTKQALYTCSHLVLFVCLQACSKNLRRAVALLEEGKWTPTPPCEVLKFENFAHAFDLSRSGNTHGCVVVGLIVLKCLCFVRQSNRKDCD
jgi:hypothetical protein